MSERLVADLVVERLRAWGVPRVFGHPGDGINAGYADLLGLTGIRVTDPGELGAAWDRALSADRPVVLEVRTDPDVPLLPPFPGGAQELDSFRTALDQEGEAGAGARALLDTYAAQERPRS
ncbi:hypothetical protein [Blastococcus sp. SYSU D00695]